jgi:hypothetical protein
MNGFEIALLLLFVYFSDIITYPIREGWKKFSHWKDMRDMKKSIEKLKKAKEEGKTTEDMAKEGLLTQHAETFVERMREKRAKRIFPEWVYQSYYKFMWTCWWGLLDHPRDLRRYTIHAYNRTKYGWSRMDAWFIAGHLIQILPPMLRYVKKFKHGVPQSMFLKSDPVDEYGNYTDEAMELASARFDKVIDKVIETFETASKIAESDLIYQNSKTYDVEKANKWRKQEKELHKKYPDLGFPSKVMTKKECERYEKGWELFQKHFFEFGD